MANAYQRQQELLDLHIHRGTCSHAYLFVGPRHEGIMTIALQTVSSLICRERPPGILAFCGRCEACRGIAAGTHPDVTCEDIYKNESEKQEYISVDQVRRFRDRAGRSAYGGTHVFIVRDVGRFTREAANAFLKILEEPRGDTLFLLLAETLEEVLPTIRSRAWIIRFWPVLKHLPPMPFAKETDTLFSTSLADRLRYADSLRDHPDKMRVWYADAVAHVGSLLHETLIRSARSPAELSPLSAARACRSLLEGEARFAKPYGTKRILFESDILQIGS